jgi:hypothetical protein
MTLPLAPGQLLPVLVFDGQLGMPANKGRTLSGKLLPCRCHFEKLVLLRTRTCRVRQRAALLRVVAIFGCLFHDAGPPHAPDRYITVRPFWGSAERA